MSEITENESLELNNLLSFRGKVTQREMMEVSKQVEALLQRTGAKKNGCGISATFAIDTSGSGPVFDMELLIPLDREIEVEAPFTFKFRLRNAVKIRHVGSPATLEATAKKLMAYIAEKGLAPVTAGYNATVKEQTSPADMNDMIIYISM